MGKTKNWAEIMCAELGIPYQPQRVVTVRQQTRTVVILDAETNILEQVCDELGIEVLDD